MHDAALPTQTTAFESLLRRVIREETQDIRDDVRVFRGEVSVLHDELDTVRNIVGGHSQQLQTLQTDMRTVKATARNNQTETFRLGVLLDDLNDRWAASREA